MQFPISRAYSQMRAAALMLKEAIRLNEAGNNPGEEANLAKLLGSDAMLRSYWLLTYTTIVFHFAIFALNHDVRDIWWMRIGSSLYEKQDGKRTANELQCWTETFGEAG